MKNLFLTKTRWLVTIILLTALGIGNVWGAKITDYNNIVSGTEYYIGATTSSTDYYWCSPQTTTGTGVSGTAVTSKASATIVILEGSGTSWKIKIKGTSNYVTLSSSKANGKFNIAESSDNWTFSNANNLIKMLYTGSYCLQKNNSGTQFGSYGGTQTNVWLEEAAPEYTITATRNNDSYGTVEVSGTTITATPAAGYRVIAGNDGYTVTSGSATVVNNGDNTFTVTPSSNCTVQINFEAIPKYTVTLKDDGDTRTQASAGASVTLPSREGCAGYTFAGWTKTWVTDQTEWTTTAPTIIPAGSYTPAADENLYPVYTKEEGGGEPVETKTQTFQYDTWEYGGSSTDKSSYRLFHDGGYVESASDVDFSKLSKVIVYGGTFGGTSYNGISIKKADGTLWKNATVSGSKETGTNTITGGASLTGSAKLRVYSTKGTASGTGVRISKVEVYTMEGGTTTSYISVPNCCTALGSINGSINVNNATSVTLQWDAVTGAEKYQVKVPESSSHNDWTDVNSTSVTVTKSCGRAYTAYFRAIDTDGSHCAEGPESTLDIPAVSWTVSPTISHGTASPAIPGTTCNSFSTTISPESGYALPAEVTVTNADKTWNSSTGELTISNVTGNVTITVKCAAESCSGQYTFDYGGTKQCFSQVGETNEFQITGYTIPTTTTGYWVGYNGYFYNSNLGTNGAKSANNQFKYMPVANLQGSGCSASGDNYYHAMEGAYGTLRIYQNSNADNLYIGFVPAGYFMRYGSGESWSNIQLTQEGSSAVWKSAIMEMDAATIAKKYYIQIYSGASYDGSSAGVSINSWTNGENTISSMQRKTNSGDNWASGVTAGMRGFFRTWTNNCANNGYCHFVPVHRIVYHANWPAGESPADTYSVDVSVEETNNSIELASAPSAPTGYHFVGWYDAASGGDEVTGTQTISAGTSADVELYAHWSNQTAITLSKGAQGSANGCAVGTYGSNAVGSFTAVTYGGTTYRLLGYSKSGSPSEIVIDASGNFVANTTYTDASGNWTSTEAAVTLVAQWQAGHTITWSANGEIYATTFVDADGTLVLPDGTPTSCDAGDTDTYLTFMGWYSTAAGTNSAPTASIGSCGTQATTSIVPDANQTYYAVWGDGEVEAGWTETTIGSISPSDDVVIMMKNSTGGYYVLPSNGGNARPSASALTVDEGVITSTVLDDYKWNISNSSGTLTIYPSGTTSTWLYCTNDNDGVRIGTGEANAFTINTYETGHDFLYNSTHSRYVGVYNSADWRCYALSGTPPSLTTNISGQTVKFFKQSIGATGFISSCCSSAAVVSVTPTNDNLELDIDGQATTSVSVSQTGGGAGKFYPPTITPAGATCDFTTSYKTVNYSTTFTATAAGTYTVKADFTETAAGCAKYGSATITVAANPILTPSSNNVEIDATCGSASSATDITVNSRYLSSTSITASVVTSTGTGSFKISSDNSSFDTSNKTITGGTSSKATSHIYVRYDATEGQTGSATGTLTLTCGEKVVNIPLSATVTCSAHVVLSSEAPIQITAANGIWVEAANEVTVTGSYLTTNLNNANVSIRAYTDNAHFQIKTGGTAGEGAAKTSQGNAWSLATNVGTASWNGSIGIVYKPAAHNTTESATLTVEVYRANGSTVYDTKTYTLYGRSLPENFVIAVTDGSGNWYAVPADMVAPWGSSCSSGLNTYTPYSIEVNDASHPTAVTGNTPSRAVYTAAARTGNVNTNPQTLSYKSVYLGGNNYLYGSSTNVDSDGSNTSIQNASYASSEKQKWFLDVVDWEHKEYNMHVATTLNTNVLAYTTSGGAQNVGQYAPNAGTTKKAIYILPATSTCDNYIAPENITCQGINATNYLIRFKPDRTKNYEVSLDGSSWSDVTTSIINECTDAEHPTLVEAQIPLATYRGQTVNIRVKAAGSCAESTTFDVPDPSLTVNDGTWLTMMGIAGSAFENSDNNVTISGLASCANTVEVAVSGANADKIGASINSTTGVVTISMTAANAIAGTYNATLTFTADGATTRTQDVTITIRDLAEMTFSIEDLHNGKICANDLTYDAKFYVYLNGGSAVYSANDRTTKVNANSQFASAVFVRDLSAGGNDWNTGFNYNVNTGVANFYIPTTNLIYGHTYRISYYNNLANSGAGLFSSEGLGFADAHLDFVYSADCNAPTALVPCNVSPTSVVTKWDFDACAGNATVDVYTKSNTELVNQTFTTNTHMYPWSQRQTTRWNTAGTGKNTNSSYGYPMNYSTSSNTYASWIYSPIFENWKPDLTTNDEVVLEMKFYNSHASTSYTVDWCVTTTPQAGSSGVPTPKKIYVDGVYQSADMQSFSVPSGNKYTTFTFTLKGLATTDVLFIKPRATVAGNCHLNYVKMYTTAKNSVTSSSPACSDKEVEITGLTANTLYYYTVTNSGHTSNEVPFTTWTSGSSYVKFYKDEGRTIEIEALDKIEVLGGQTTHVYMDGQKVPGCEVVPTVSSGYGLEDHTTYDPATGALSGYIDLTLTNPAVTSGTLTITDGTGSTTTREIKSSDCPTDFETLALHATSITKNGATANWNSTADFEGVTEGTLYLYRDGVVDAEYITNESFETGDLTGWNFLNVGAIYACDAYSVVSSNTHSGTNALYATKEGTIYAGFGYTTVIYGNPVTLPAGKYEMTSWVKVPVYNGYSDKLSYFKQGLAGCTLIGSTNETCYALSPDYTEIQSNDAYVQITDVFVLENPIKALPFVGHRADYGYTFHPFYLDDVSLKRISAPNAEEPDKVFPIADMSAASSQDLGTLSGNTQYSYLLKNENGCPSNTITFKTEPADGPTISAEDIEISAPAGSSSTGVIVVQVWDAIAEISVSKGVASGSDQITLSNTTVPQEGGTIQVLFTPNTDPGSTGTCPVILNTRGLAEPVTVNIRWAVTAGEDTDKPIVEVTEVSNEWIKIEHNVEADHVTIILNREKTADEIETNVGDEIFFSKYYEAYSHQKLWAIYNPTSDTISLAGMEVWRSSSKYDAWHSNVMDLSEMGYIKPGWICPNEEIVVYTTNQVGTCEQNTVGLDVMSTWWQGGTSSDMPLSFSGDDALLLVRNTSAVSAARHNALPTTSAKTGEAISWPDPISNARGEWYMLDIIGGRTDGGLPSGKNVQTPWHWYNSKTGEYEDGDDTGWVGYGKDMSGVADYNTSSEHPGYLLSTNRCLLVRLKNVTSGANAINSNIDNMVTLNTEWQGSHVPTGGDQAAISCANFSFVGGYDYSGYYNTWTEIGDYEVAGTPNPDGSFTAEFGVNEFYCKTVHIEVSSTEIINGVETQNVHAYEDYKVPIVVDADNLTTAKLFEFGGDTCATCDVVIRDEAKLSHVSGSVDQFRNMIVYPGAKFDNSAKQGFLLDGLLMEAKNDIVGYAIINNNGSTIAAGKIVHVKRIDDQYWYPFSLPYDCDVSAIRQLNGKTMGEYWEDWGIKYYDGAARQAAGESSAPGANSKFWKQMPVSGTLRANEAYIIGLFTTEWAGQFKSVYFPPKTTKEYSEAGEDAKTTDVYNWAEGLANEPRHHGWNFVGSPYISLFGSSEEGHGLNNRTNLYLGKIEEDGSYSDLNNVYVSIPDGAASRTYTQAKASVTKIEPFKGYFVQTVDPTNGINNTLNLIYQKTDRTLPSAPMRKATAQKERVEAELVVESANGSDNAGVVVDDIYTTGYEIGGDLTKMYAAATKPQLYFLGNNNEKMAYIALPDANAENIPMELYAPSSGQYTIRLNKRFSRTNGAESVEILYNGDVVTNLLIDSCTINVSNKGVISGYSVRIRRSAQVITSTDLINGEHITVITNNGQMSITNLPGDAKVLIYDMTGRLLDSRTAEGASVVNVDAPQQGVYNVVVQSASGNASIKTIVR